MPLGLALATIAPVSPENRFRALIDPHAVVEAIGQSPQLQALPVRRYRKADAYPEGATAEMRLFDMQIGALEVPDDTDTRRRWRAPGP